MHTTSTERPRYEGAAGPTAGRESLGYVPSPERERHVSSKNASRPPGQPAAAELVKVGVAAHEPSFIAVKTLICQNRGRHDRQVGFGMHAEEPNEVFAKVVKRLKKSFAPSGENNPIPVGSTVEEVTLILTNELLSAGIIADPEMVRKKAQEIIDQAPQ